MCTTHRAPCLDSSDDMASDVHHPGLPRLSLSLKLKILPGQAASMRVTVPD